jgi:hypothetical protein
MLLTFMIVMSFQDLFFYDEKKPIKHSSRTNFFLISTWELFNPFNSSQFCWCSIYFWRKIKINYVDDNCVKVCRSKKKRSFHFIEFSAIVSISLIYFQWIEIFWQQQITDCSVSVNIHSCFIDYSTVLSSNRFSSSSMLFTLKLLTILLLKDSRKNINFYLRTIELRFFIENLTEAHIVIAILSLKWNSVVNSIGNS